MKTTKLTIRKIGNSLGVILPAWALEELGVGVGDAVYYELDPETRSLLLLRNEPGNPRE